MTLAITDYRDQQDMEAAQAEAEDKQFTADPEPHEEGITEDEMDALFNEPTQLDHIKHMLLQLSQKIGAMESRLPSSY